MRYLLIIIAITLTQNLTAQPPRIIYPVGIMKDLIFGAFTADNRYFIAKKKDWVYVWNQSTGRFLYEFNVGSYPPGELYNDGQHTNFYYETGKGIFTTTIESGKQTAVLAANNIKGTGIKFSPDRKSIVTHLGNAGDSLFLSTFPGGKLLHGLKGDYKRMVFTKDNRYIVTVFHDTCMKWDLSNGSLIHSIPMHTDNNASVSISPEGSFVAYADKKVVYLLDVNSGVPAKALDGHNGIITGINFSNDGRKLLSYGLDSTAIVWDTKSRSQSKKFNYPPNYHYYYNRSLISPDGKKVVVGNHKKLFVYDLSSGKLSDSINFPSLYLYDNFFEFSSDSKNIWVKGRGGSFLMLYSLQKKETTVLRTFSDRIQQTIVSPGNSYLLSLNKDSVTLSETKTGRSLAKMTMEREDFDCVFNDDCSRLLMWDGREFALMSIPDGRKITSIRNEKYGKVYNAIISGDNKKIALVNNRDVSIWESSSGKELIRITVPSIIQHHSPVFNQDGKYLAIPLRDSVLICLTENGKVFKRFYKGDTDSSFNYVYFSPDDKYIMTHDNALKYATVWDVASGKKLYVINNSKPKFTKNAAYIIAGKTVYDITNGKQIEITDATAKYPVMRPDADQYQATIDDLDAKGENKMVKVTDNKTGKYYYFMPLTGTDYLVFDSLGRYDGSPLARGLLNFACGNGLNTDKDIPRKLWVPGLVEKIMGGEVISAKKLDELLLCK